MTKYVRQDPEMSRRKFINVALGSTAAVGVGSLVVALAGVRPPIRLTFGKIPALAGDVLVHAEGPNTGKPVQVSELNNVTPVTAWPMGKNKKGEPVIKSDEPNNLLIMYKFNPGQLVAPTNIPQTENGVVVYSDICQHLGCQVGPNTAKPGTLLCPCHSGAYDPKAGCMVIGGPPPHPLPQLPIKLDGASVMATGPLDAPYFGLTASDWTTLLEEAKTI